MNLSQITDLELRKELRKRNKLRKKHSRKAHGLGPRKKGMGVRIGLFDIAATKARKFLDAGSFVRTDGSEVCKGRDWRVRTGELAERSGGQCEYILIPPPEMVGLRVSDLRCHMRATIPAHIEPRHPKRDDRLGNLKHYCFEHDRLTEKQSWRKIRSGKVGA